MDRRCVGVPVKNTLIVEAVKHGFGDAELIEHVVDGFFERLGRAGALARRVGRNRLLQVGGDAQIVDDQAARLVLVDPIYPCNRLHQPVTVHRLVDVHGVKGRRVEAGQPHVADDDQFEGRIRVFEALGEGFAARLVADVGLIVLRIAGAAGHDNLDRTKFVRVPVPIWAQFNHFRVQIYADAAAHADDHAFAVERFELAPRSGSRCPARSGRGVPARRPSPPTATTST